MTDYKLDPEKLEAAVRALRFNQETYQSWRIWDSDLAAALTAYGVPELEARVAELEAQLKDAVNALRAQVEAGKALAHAVEQRGGYGIGNAVDRALAKAKKAGLL